MQNSQTCGQFFEPLYMEVVINIVLQMPEDVAVVELVAEDKRSLVVIEAIDFTLNHSVCRMFQCDSSGWIGR